MLSTPARPDAASPQAVFLKLFSRARHMRRGYAVGVGLHPDMVPTAVAQAYPAHGYTKPTVNTKGVMNVRTCVETVCKTLLPSKWRGRRCRACKTIRERVQRSQRTPEELERDRSKARLRMRERNSTRRKITPERRARIDREKELIAQRRIDATKRRRERKKAEREHRKEWFLVRVNRECVDCALPLTWFRPLDSPRCESCAKHHQGSWHGCYGRRCRKQNVPYETFNITTIFERDRWTCQICGIPTPIEKRGNTVYTPENLDAPELDHVWPLSLIVDGQKSPGHIPSNCQCACRGCNAKKGAKAVI